VAQAARHRARCHKLDDAQVHAAIGEAVRLLPQFAAAVEAYLDRTVQGA
jgi:hypothetical protein